MKNQGIDITTAVDVLGNNADNRSEKFNSVKQAFLYFVREKFDHWKRQYTNKEERSLIESKLTSIAPERVDIILLNPEVSKVLLSDGDQINHKVFTNYLMQCLYAEEAKTKGKIDSESRTLWTANGDFLIQRQENDEFITYEAFKLADRVALDFFSPNCLNVSHFDLAEDPTSEISNYGFEEVENLCELLHESVAELDNEGAYFLDLIGIFSRTIILNKVTPSNGKRIFFSGSDNDHVGRSVLSNAELVSKEMIIESLVHESIHSLLYMIDRLNQWQPDYDSLHINEIGRNVESVWSGNMITIHSFLQACFVWYGLFEFWKYAKLSNLSYDQSFVSERLKFIQTGFENLNLTEFEKKYDLTLVEITKESIDLMKSRVVQSII